MKKRVDGGTCALVGGKVCLTQAAGSDSEAIALHIGTCWRRPSNLFADVEGTTGGVTC